MSKVSYSNPLRALEADSYFKTVSLPCVHRVLHQFGRYALVIPLESMNVQEAFLLHGKTPVYILNSVDVPVYTSHGIYSHDLK